MNKSETVEVELSQEVTAKRSSLVNISYSANTSASPSVTERNQDDDTTITDYSQSGDDISMPTADNMMSAVSRWSLSKGHKRSRSNTMDYSHSSAPTATVSHRRSSSCDVNLLEYKNTNESTAREVESSSPLVPVKSDKQQQEQEPQQQQQPQSDLFQDDVDFSSMFGKWKGMQRLYTTHNQDVVATGWPLHDQYFLYPNKTYQNQCCTEA